MNVPLQNQNQKNSRSFFEFIRFLVIISAVVFAIRLYIATPFIVSGSSMDPTFAHGEYLIVDEISYRLREPKRGDVIVFRFPQKRTQFFIKRIIGLPGETVEIQDGTLSVKNEGTPRGFVLDEPYLVGGTAGSFLVTLGESDYFVLGDNRSASFDSRSWGTLPRDLIVGRALARLFPLQNIALFPGYVGRGN
ncbi:MAG: signal peptidase I [bacterium]|nr:signal peptidase I [bacterium]MDZ4285052.1 signal peptidase I [Patescibacteria group bacterium]